MKTGKKKFRTNFSFSSYLISQISLSEVNFFFIEDIKYYPQNKNQRTYYPQRTKGNKHVILIKHPARNKNCNIIDYKKK